MENEELDENRDVDIKEEDILDEEEENFDDDTEPAGEEEEEKKEEEEDDEIPEKFKGKTTKEIINSYKNLESSLHAKANEIAQAILAKKNKSIKVDVDPNEEFDLGLSEEEIQKLTPKEFAKLMSKKVSEKATEIARKTVEDYNEIRTQVSREINDSTKKFPQLKENKEFREMVLNTLEAAKSRKETMSLTDACTKVAKALGIKEQEQKKEDRKKIVKRTVVEKRTGSDDKPVQSDEDKVKSGILSAGESTSFLGGL
jgi:hypothetical protein